MNIKIQKIRPDAQIPIRASDGAIGYDVFASRVLDKNSKEIIQDLPASIPAGESLLVGIGVKMAIPWPYQCEVRPRSGLATKFDIELSNSPGTIDPDFRGEAGVLLRNRGKETFVVEKNMRIAQLIFSEIEIPILEESDDLPPTRRDEGGFGSTGFFGEGMGTEEYSEKIRIKDEYYMKVVLAVADRSMCVRGAEKEGEKFIRDKNGHLIGQKRKFGCIIVKNDNIVSQGFNDQYRGSEKCLKSGCLRESLKIPSGTKLETCRAMHAEWWAFTNAGKMPNPPSLKGSTVYVNAEPCEICAKMIVGFEVETMVFPKGIYPQNGIEILKEGGINIRYVDISKL